MVERQRFRDVGRSVVVRIDAATPESGETLFARLGRHLLDLKRRGLLATLAPLDTARGAGFNLARPAGQETPGTGCKPGASSRTGRSAERRVGKDGDCTWRTRWSPV